MFRRLFAPLLATAIAVAVIGVPTVVRASTVVACATEAGYAQCGRVFPDPEATMDTDPNAEGAVAAGRFIQFGTGTAGTSEIWDGLKLLQSHHERWLDVRTLDDMLGDADARSAGLWTGGQRQRLPLILARATDETVPATAKQRFVFTLSLHGIERAGVEGGTRSLEDMITYARCESMGSLEAARADDICAMQTQVKRGTYQEGEGGFPVRLLPWDESSLTMGELLKRAEIYFAYVNSDGWHRGDVGTPGGIGHYQRYNANGADPNRDWPTVGYTFRPYTPASEPETRGFMAALKSISGTWAGGGDLHGQGGAPVLTYSMLAAGQHDYRKDQRIRYAVQRAQIDATKRLTWSPLIVPYGADRKVVPVPVLGPINQMYPQQWGTVWDTIDYTTTGDIGGFLSDDEMGLGAIPLDNEMSYSHVTNCGVGSCYVTQIEQLHVAGNKGLIASHIDSVIRTTSTEYRFPFLGRGAYVRYDATVSETAGKTGMKSRQALPAQDTITGVIPCGATACTSPEFVVRSETDGIFNGGLTADVAFAATHSAMDLRGDVSVQMLDSSHGEEAEWEDVASNHSAGQLYLNNGTSVGVNNPPPGRYRIQITGNPGPFTYEVRFTSRQAWPDPGQRAFKATPFRFFDDLNKYLPEANRFDPLSTGAIIDDPTTLKGYDVVVLVDDPLDGWDEAEPKQSTLPKTKHDAYYRALKSWVRAGGKLVLLDGAMQGIPSLTGKALEIRRVRQYAGWIGFSDEGRATYEDPLAKGVNVPGAAEGPGRRHQTYEPVPIGYKISDTIGDLTDVHAPVWGVDYNDMTRARGRIAGLTSGAVSLGELPMGKGAIRFAGALLPTPSTSFDHPYGVKSYALTYTGWQLFQNLVQTPVRAATVNEPGTKVLGTRHLANTGVAPGWIFFALLIVPALLVGRRLRDTFWM